MYGSVCVRACVFVVYLSTAVAIRRVAQSPASPLSTGTPQCPGGITTNDTHHPPTQPRALEHYVRRKIQLVVCVHLFSFSCRTLWRVCQVSEAPLPPPPPRASWASQAWEPAVWAACPPRASTERLAQEPAWAGWVCQVRSVRATARSKAE